MRVMQVGEQAVAIWFVEESAPPLCSMLALVQGALRFSGYQPWQKTEAECFGGGDETLLIARRGKETAARHFSS